MSRPHLCCPYKGLLGLAGPCSRLFFVFLCIIFTVQQLCGPQAVRFLAENAASMLEMHYRAFCKLLNILWRPLHAALVFHMKKMAPFSGVIESDLFVRLLHSKDCTRAASGFCVSSACKVFSTVFCAIFFPIYLAFSCLFCCRLFQEVSGWSRRLEICVAQALFAKSFSQMVAAIVLEKSHVSGHEKQQ